jgi:hypothetical protein
MDKCLSIKYKNKYIFRIFNKNKIIILIFIICLVSKFMKLTKFCHFIKNNKYNNLEKYIFKDVYLCFFKNKDK